MSMQVIPPVFVHVENPDDVIQSFLSSLAKTGENGKHYVLADNLDGKGPFINMWDSVDFGPPPTSAQISALLPNALSLAAARNLKASLSNVDPILSAGLIELVAVLITKGTISKTDISTALLNAINSRRTLLGLSTL